MAKLNAKLEAKHVGIVAISVDTKDDSARLAQEMSIPYPLLSDADLRVALSYGVAMKGEDLAVPSVFIVLPNREIFWSQVGETVGDRPSDEDVLRRVDEALAASGRT